MAKSSVQAKSGKSAKPAKKAPEIIYDFSDGPRPRTSILTVILCVLNVLAAGGFVFCLLLDVEARRAWSYSVFLHDLALMGLPLEEEDTGPTGSREIFPKPKLTSGPLRTAFQERRTGGTVGAGDFVALDEGWTVRIEPRHLTVETLKEYFGDLDKTDSPVKTLEAELGRIKETILIDIESAGKQAAAVEKTVEDKRQKLEFSLLPVSGDVFQVAALYKHVHSAAEGSLDQHIAEAVQRRLILDVLQPIEMARPGDVKNRYLERAGKLQEVSLQVLRGKLMQRIDDAMAGKYEPFPEADWAKDTVEKRHNIAMVLFSIAHLVKPDGSYLYPRGPERVQAVVGLVEFATAAQTHTRSLNMLHKRVEDLIQSDREGSNVNIAPDKIARTPGFIHKYPVLVQKIREIIVEIDQQERRLGRLRDQTTQVKKTVEDREEHRKVITDELIQKREETAKMLARLRVLQALVFRAHLELADAEEINARLEYELRMIEKKLPKYGGASR